MVLFIFLPYITSVDTGNRVADIALAALAGIPNLAARVVNVPFNAGWVVNEAYNQGTEAVIGSKGLSGEGLAMDIMMVEMATGMPIGTVIENIRSGGAYLKSSLGMVGNPLVPEASAAETVSEPVIPERIYRAGGKNPSSLTPRPVDNGMLSTRDSLSNPWPLEPGQEAVFPLNKDIQVIDTSKLPSGTIIPDGYPFGPQRQGHVSIGPNVPPQVVKDAIIETISKSKFGSGYFVNDIDIFSLHNNLDIQ